VNCNNGDSRIHTKIYSPWTQIARHTKAHQNRDERKKKKKESPVGKNTYSGGKASREKTWGKRGGVGNVSPL